MVRSIDTGSVVGPLPTELTTVRDVAFLADGSLIALGYRFRRRNPLLQNGLSQTAVQVGLD